MASDSKNVLKGFVPFDNKPVVSRTTLRRSQAALYDLLSKRVATGKTVTYEEAHKIWVSKACRNKIGDKPASWVWRYDHDKEKYYSVLEEMPDDLIKMTVIGWLTRTIGILVMKGYLKVIPQVELI